MVKKEFLIYNYYYTIPCANCGNINPALDFAEYDGTHPSQVGALQLEEDIAIWKPSPNDEIASQEFPHEAWGRQRVLSLGRSGQWKRLESLDEISPGTLWDEAAPTWASQFSEGGDYHHKHIILPELYRLLDIHKNEIILDVACGEGNVARYLAKEGAKVTGIDISRMLDFAIEREEKEQLGIRYVKLNAEYISDKFGKSSFDKVICNMALMDIEDYKTTLQQISQVLKENGIFVFSILHPAFSWPVCNTIRVPGDSQRNEDRMKVVIDYFDERPMLYTETLSTIQFIRPISAYLNELVRNNFALVEVSEPKASEEVVQQFPRKAYLNDQMVPDFLIVKAMKKLVSCQNAKI
ncbi:MAG: class I SAM-dependent methyltransferase [Promethearchaeota archaeon]